MKPIQATINAGRLPNEVTMRRNLSRWLRSVNSLCSSLMGEQVSHLQVLSALCMFVFLTLAVFTIQRDFLVTLLFLALAAFCRRGLEEKGGVE